MTKLEKQNLKGANLARIDEVINVLERKAEPIEINMEMFFGVGAGHCQLPSNAGFPTIGALRAAKVVPSCGVAGCLAGLLVYMFSPDDCETGTKKIRENAIATLGIEFEPMNVPFETESLRGGARCPCSLRTRAPVTATPRRSAG